MPKINIQKGITADLLQDLVAALAQKCDQGDPGTAATIAIGTVTTGAPGSAATVTNSGTSSAAVLDFVIPEGGPGTDAAYASTAEITTGTETAKAVTPAGLAAFEKTIDPAISTTGSSTGTLSFLLGWLAKQVKAITGKTNWYDTPSVSLESIWTEPGLTQVIIPVGSTGITVFVDRNCTYTSLKAYCFDLAGAAQTPTSLTVNVALAGTSQFTTSAITTASATYDNTDFNATAGDLLKFTVSNTTGLTGGVAVALVKGRM